MRIFIRTVFGLAGLALGWVIFSDAPQAAPSKSTINRNPQAVAAEIDRLIDAKLAEAKLPTSLLADDAEFIRRLSLDIRGRVPFADRVATFLADTDPDKRAKLIDEFLADHEYGEHFAIIWYHRMVKPDDDNRQVISDNLQEWLAESFNQNHGWDRVVTNILTAEGNRDKNPATVFWLANVSANKANRQPEPNKITAAASHLFLGVKLECCECHNHPFSTLKQTDFWGTAAFFTTTHAENSSNKDAKAGTVPSIHEGGSAGKTKKKDQPAEGPAPAGSIVIPDTKGKTVKAKFLQGQEPPVAGKSLRPTFAAWLTSPANPFFARALVNKMWANFFGKGIVNPVDDMRAEAKTQHPELIKALAEEFTASGFDLKHLIRCICNSKTYQRTSRPSKENKEDEELYSHAPVKVMSADMLYDSLAVVLDHAAAEKAQAKGKAAGPKKGRGDARTQFRKFFHAEADDDSGVVEDYSHGIPQVLRLMNSQRINDTSAVVSKLTKANGSPEKVIEGLYLRVLSRLPTETETKRMKEYVSSSSEAAKGYGDLMWVLLNSGEFLFNH